MDRLDVSHFADFRQVGFAWQREHFGDHGLVQGLVRQHAAQCTDQARVQRQAGALLMLGDQFLQHLYRQLLAGIPAVEAVAVVLLSLIHI